MHIASIKKRDVANGPGVRVSVFVSGCRHACPECFNPEAWAFDYGKPYTQDAEAEILKALEPEYIKGLTFLGGEPLEPENAPTVLDLAQKVRAAYPQKTIWLFSGWTLEKLDQMAQDRPEISKVLDLVDVLVDGPFVAGKKDIKLRFRGSSNQRLIDIKKTRAAGQVVFWEG